MFWRDGVYYVKKMMRGIERKLSTRKRDYKSALRRYHEIMKAWNDGESGWAGAAVPTFSEYWQEHYRPAYTVRKTPKPNSDPKHPVYRDDSLVASFLALHGPKPLDVITKTIAQKWTNLRRNDSYQRKEGGTRYPLSEGTVRREVAFLRTVFEKAVQDGYVKLNPFQGIETEPSSPKNRVLTLDEQDKLLAELQPEFQRWLLFMLGTGLRLAECSNINPATDVDFPKRFVRVTRKTRGLKKKVQDVPLIDTYVLDIIQEQLTVEGRWWLAGGSNTRLMLARAAERAGIDHLSPHTLRHTFATRYLQGGGNIYILSKILGHSSVRITEQVYAHLLGADLLEQSAHVKLGLQPAQPAKVLPFSAQK